MDPVKHQIIRSEPFREFISQIRKLAGGKSLTVHGAAGSLMAFLSTAAFEERGGQVLLVASDADKAEKLRDDCALLIGEAHVRLYGERSTHHAEMLDMTSSIARIEALKTLSARQDVLVVASPRSLAARTPPPADFAKSVIELQANSEYSFSQLIEELTSLGFERKQFVEGYGDFSVRGGILDVFPLVGESPIRMEFWGDTIESIREFDILSQRSIRELQVATIVPDINRLSEINEASIFDYLKPDTVIILDEPELIRREIEENLSLGIEDGSSWEDIENYVRRFPTVVHSFLRSTGDSAIIDCAAIHQPSFNGSIKTLVRELKKLDGEGLHVYLRADTQEEAERLRELIEEELDRANVHISDSISHISTDVLHAGFIYLAAKLAVFTEHEIFGRLKRRGLSRQRKFKGFTHKELLQLRNKDYVVHADYGIGQFAGLQKISVRGAEQEVMKILYLDNDIVFVNLNYIDRVQKYAASEGHLPKLTKLGAPDWERLKARAKRRVKDIARDLIELYALRKREKGFAFSPDAHWQKEMEASFIYEDTPDQAQSTLDVKRDMESESPMDRLICGDVGFGKTEVAVRAAFKAVFDGQQVAILVPTTILAQQHFNTFRDRLGRYPIRIEFISRFKGSREQATIVDALHAGSIDIIIGTHRLLSKDIRFKNLGLLIVDEEHRFGVTAKEKLRRMKASVDTLTLTATPIPRTLHFSLMGARDISLINTPPRNRLPIVTEIVQFNWKIIREAILKEVHRGGQVYFVHDRVQKIEEMKSLLENHIPGVRYAVAHGQMKGHQLEKIMVGFLEKKYDVLVCTKIIESGIDIPSVNTIVINRADRFGLAELYQLRGRVGRSNVQAYAYLLTPPISVLSREALRRMQAIEEFSELGSGFSLAMRDLEIRGAGNLLGAEQSGYILQMGYEMYERIVQEAVAELKAEEFHDITSERFPKPHATVDATVDAYIPDIYVESDMERLEIYRRLSRIEEIQQVEEIRLELRDRFGEHPPEVEHLLSLVELRLLAAQLGVSRIAINDDEVVLVLPEDQNNMLYREESGRPARFQRLMESVSALAEERFRLKQEGKSLTLVLDGRLFDSGAMRLVSMKKFMTTLVDRV